MTCTYSHVNNKYVHTCKKYSILHRHLHIATSRKQYHLIATSRNIYIYVQIRTYVRCAASKQPQQESLDRKKKGRTQQGSRSQQQEQRQQTSRQRREGKQQTYRSQEQRTMNERRRNRDATLRTTPQWRRDASWNGRATDTKAVKNKG